MDKKTAIVTGASKGIGKAISMYLAKNGYDLLLISRNLKNLESVADEIDKEGKGKYKKQKTTILASDVYDYESLKSGILSFYNENQKIDVLVNCAGYVKRGSSELDREEFLKMINTNLIGTFNLINIVSPLMKLKNSGRIINIASISGKVAKKYLAGYAASKFGVMGLNESLQKELAPYNIYVTAICPNLVSTDMTSDVNMNESDMISVSDIVKTVDYIIHLSSAVSLKEITMQCRAKLLEEA